MKAAVYYNNRDIRLEEVEKPRIGRDEVLVKIISSGICGSDVMEWYRIKKAPLVLGHEIAGVIEEVGDNVKVFKVGDRVMATHHVPCEECVYCNNGNETDCSTLHNTKFYPGGFAEYVRLPAINVEKGLIKLPDGVSFDEGTFLEPMGCVARAQRRLGIGENDTVLVLGSGLSGLLHAQIAKSKGARVITTDIMPYRLEMAKGLGIDYVFDAREDIPERVKELNSGRLADKVIVCAAAPMVIKQAMDSVDRGGKILIFALFAPLSDVQINVPQLLSKGITVTTSYAAVKKDLEEALELISDKRINVEGMITHRLPLAETGKGFELMVNPENSMKIIIEPQK